MRPSHSIVMICVLVLGMGNLRAAWADIYRCPDQTGRLIYQNYPCPDGSPPVIVSQSTSASLPGVSSWVPSAPVEPFRTVPAPAALVHPQPRPINSREFGLIALGTRTDDVRRAFGEPAAIVPESTVVRRAGRDFVVVQRSTWVYPGTDQVMRTLLAVENGVVVGKVKQR